LGSKRLYEAKVISYHSMEPSTARALETRTTSYAPALEKNQTVVVRSVDQETVNVIWFDVTAWYPVFDAVAVTLYVPRCALLLSL